MIPALEMLTRESNAKLQVQEDERQLDAERELAIFRIVQERAQLPGGNVHVKSVRGKGTK